MIKFNLTVLIFFFILDPVLPQFNFLSPFLGRGISTFNPLSGSTRIGSDGSIYTSNPYSGTVSVGPNGAIQVGGNNNVNSINNNGNSKNNRNIVSENSANNIYGSNNNINSITTNGNSNNNNNIVVGNTANNIFGENINANSINLDGNSNNVNAVLAGNSANNIYSGNFNPASLVQAVGQSGILNQISGAIANQNPNIRNLQNNILQSYFPFNQPQLPQQQIQQPRPIQQPQQQRPKPVQQRPQIGCGRSRQFSSKFIIGGAEAQRGEWPWLGSLFLHQENKFLCGLSLISEKHVITAAHCIEYPNEPYRYSVLVGRYNLHNDRETGYQRRQISALEVHEDYRKRNNPNADADLAILKMKSAVSYSDQIQPICLPRSSIDYSNQQGVVIGYGKSEQPGEYVPIPRQINVKSVDLYTCLYSDQAYVKIASKRNFCAAGYGKSPCKGDSGSGFYIQDPSSSQWTIYGLVSEGIITNGFCDASKYVVFVDLTKFMPWIFQKLRKLQTDPCDPFPCGNQAECFVFNDSHFCACKAGYKGDPNKGCTR